MRRWREKKKRNELMKCQEINEESRICQKRQKEKWWIERARPITCHLQCIDRSSLAGILNHDVTVDAWYKSVRKS